MAIRGLALVLSIGPCPAIEPPEAGGRVVTGTFVTERAEIVRVWLEGATEPIGATPSHPFYSKDRSGWVPAGELREGEAVRTLAAAAKVERIEPAAEPTTVYNFEVHRSHTYYVGSDQVWVHNPCFNSGGSSVHVSVQGRTLRGEIGFLEKADDIAGLARQALDYGRQSGATRAVLETGPIVNASLLEKMVRLASGGGTRVGGRVVQVGKDTFEIIWDALP